MGRTDVCVGLCMNPNRDISLANRGGRHDTPRYHSKQVVVRRLHLFVRRVSWANGLYSVYRDQWVVLAMFLQRKH